MFKFLFLLVSALGFAAPKPMDVYFGVIETPKAKGILGNAFLLFSKKNDPYFEGNVYHYDFLDSNPDASTSKINLSLVGLHLKKEVFVNFFEDFVEQKNHSVTLYRLDLTQSETDTLFTLLEKDLIRKDVMTDVMDGSFSSGKSFFRAALPTHIGRILKGHSAFVGQKYIFTSIDLKASRNTMEFHEAVSKTIDLCHFEKVETVFENYFELFTKDPKAYSLNPLLTLMESCNDISFFITALEKASLMFPPSFVEEKQKTLELIATLKRKGHD